MAENDKTGPSRRSRRRKFGEPLLRAGSRSAPSVEGRGRGADDDPRPVPSLSVASPIPAPGREPQAQEPQVVEAAALRGDAVTMVIDEDGAWRMPDAAERHEDPDPDWAPPPISVVDDAPAPLYPPDYELPIVELPPEVLEEPEAETAALGVPALAPPEGAAALLEWAKPTEPQPAEPLVVPTVFVEPELPVPDASMLDASVPESVPPTIEEVLPVSVPAEPEFVAPAPAEPILAASEPVAPVASDTTLGHFEHVTVEAVEPAAIATEISVAWPPEPDIEPPSAILREEHEPEPSPALIREEPALLPPAILREEHEPEPSPAPIREEPALSPRAASHEEREPDPLPAPVREEPVFSPRTPSESGPALAPHPALPDWWLALQKRPSVAPAFAPGPPESAAAPEPAPSAATAAEEEPDPPPASRPVPRSREGSPFGVVLLVFYIAVTLIVAAAELIDFWETVDHGGLAAWLMAVLRSVLAAWTGLMLVLLLFRYRAFPAIFTAYTALHVAYLGLFGLAYAHLTQGAVFFYVAGAAGVAVVACLYVLLSRRMRAMFRRQRQWA